MDWHLIRKQEGVDSKKMKPFPRINMTPELAVCLFQATSWSGKHVRGGFRWASLGQSSFSQGDAKHGKPSSVAFHTGARNFAQTFVIINFQWQVNFSSNKFCSLCDFAIQIFQALTSSKHPPNLIPLLLSIYATPKACNRLLQKPRAQGARSSKFTKYRKLGRPWLRLCERMLWYFHVRFCTSQRFLETTSRALILVVWCGWCGCQTKLVFANFESVSSARLSLSTMDFEVGSLGIISSVSRAWMSALDFDGSFAFLILFEGTALSCLMSWPRLEEDAMR